MIFGDLRGLTEIDLVDNQLTTIHADAFANTMKLKKLNLENNRLNDTELPFMHLNKLIVLNLASNHLTRMPSEITLNLKDLNELDLRFNNITTLKFSELHNTNINLDKKGHYAIYSEDETKISSSISTSLYGNPLECDGSMYHFFKGTDHDNLAVAFSCSNTFDGYFVDRYPKCPDECECSKLKTSTGNWTLMSCERRELETVPEIDIADNTSIELKISKNSLTELPNFLNHFNIIMIQASNNQISIIEVKNLPPNLRALDVSHNHIQTISAAVLDHVNNRNSLDIILLQENPFSCDCSEDMDKLIELLSSPKSDRIGAKCDEQHELSTDGIGVFCKIRKIIWITTVLAVVAVVAVLSLIFYNKHKQLIRVWLYAHNCCLWLVDEDYVDKDKEYDAFISYSHLDAVYAHSLVTKLESLMLEDGSQRFKLCVHERDFLGGQDIQRSVSLLPHYVHSSHHFPTIFIYLSQILHSVKMSRRTIIILSANFLQSAWATHEFECAYRRSIAERRNCLIVVKHGDIGNVLHPTIESYIKTNTYIESDSTHFWKKIIYALPRKNLKENLNENIFLDTSTSTTHVNDDN